MQHMKINCFDEKRKNDYEVVFPTASPFTIQGSLMLSDGIAYIVINFFDEGRNEITVSLFPEHNFI